MSTSLQCRQFVSGNAVINNTVSRSYLAVLIEFANFVCLVLIILFSYFRQFACFQEFLFKQSYNQQVHFQSTNQEVIYLNMLSFTLTNKPESFT